MNIHYSSPSDRARSEEGSAGGASGSCFASWALSVSRKGELLRIIFAHSDTRRGADLAAALQLAGLVVLRARDIAEVMTLVGDPQVALILSELELKGGGGITLLQLLRAHNDSYLPVMLVAPAIAADERVRALQLGAEDVFSPELPLEEQVARVERVLRGKVKMDRIAKESAALQKLAVTDGLTQLTNHRHFQERLEDEFRRSTRYGDALSLIALDLDHFKQVNDRFGHPTGDALLRRVADLLQRNVRETDLVARCGGEEFALALPKTDAQGARVAASRLCRAFHTLKLDDAATRVTASFGVATYGESSFRDAHELYRAADSALYLAKESGRNRVTVYAPQPPRLAAPGAA